MGVYGKEVEEEIFENEYKCFLSAKRVGYINREAFFIFFFFSEKHFLNLWNDFQVFLFTELPLATSETDYKAFWKYSAI